jgi:carboxyl-terminal processing protease
MPLRLRRPSGLGDEDRPKRDKKPKAEIFDAIWNSLQTKYLHAEEIDPDELMETVIQKTIESLDDEYTVYFNEEEVENFLTGVGEATQYGIGAQVGLDQSGRVQIVKPLKDSQAQKAGLLPGDVFLEVDDTNVSGGDMTLEEVVALIKGEEGTPVKLKMQRRSREIEVTIIRGPIQLQAVTSHIFDQYLVLEVDFFGNDTVVDIAREIDKFPIPVKNGVILDLRNNPGGYLDSAIDLLARLLPEGSVAVKTRGRDILHAETVRGPADMTDFPLVVLVNERSASASEILAGAVQDLERGVVIGTKSFGKGTAQELMQFSDGSALKMTIAEWLTPNNRSIDGVGITPDYTFEDSIETEEMWEYAAKIIKRGQWR